FCFFFQAEDGIRDRTVTGVQTCALPISDRRGRRVPRERSESVRAALVISERDNVATALEALEAGQRLDLAGTTLMVQSPVPRGRSEERRVGKECRSRRWGGS